MVLPPPLAPPLPSRTVRGARRRLPWRAAIGVLLLVAGLVGTLVWVGALSPYGFVRFPLVRADRTITISRPGDYLLFEEYAGASQGDLPSALSVGVLDSSGRTVPVQPLLDAGERGAPSGYRVPLREGRAVARFAAPRRGLYLVRVEPLDVDAPDRSRYRAGLPTDLAVGRELAWGWLRTPLGLVVLGLVPLAAGVAVLVWAARRRRGPRRPAGARDLVR